MEQFNLETYNPINYNGWILGDEARKGVNIKRLGIFNPNEIKLFDFLIPYQDQRNDPGQGELVAYITEKSRIYYPGIIREVANPAAMGHDTGFWGGDPTAWKKLVDSGSDTEGELNRRPHQNRGCLIMGKAVQAVGYPSEEYHNEIADIIGDHDTRKLPATNNGKLVRMADLDWRVTYPCIQIYKQNSNPEQIIKEAERACLNEEFLPHLGKVGEGIARAELANTIFFKFGEEQARVLEKDYAPEFQRVKGFYESLR
ncbi:MAG: hypothetical protein ABIA78_02460 [archaeon]